MLKNRQVFAAALGFLGFAILSGLDDSHAQSNAAPDAVSTLPDRDGAHDFDFNLGTWKTHIRRLRNPLSGSSDAIEMNGTVTVRKIWNGRALVEEIEAEGAAGHLEGMSLFVYSPQAYQWSQTFVSSADGIIRPSMIGDFRSGRGELVSQDKLNGRAILIRGIWSNIVPNAHHYQEDYSADGGRSWEPVFVADLTRANS